MRYERATRGQSLSFDGQKAGLLHPGGELSIVGPVLLGHATL